MKPIIYILLAIFIGSILLDAFPKTFSRQTQVIKIQCIEKYPAPEQLNKSLKIIDNRLKDFGLRKYQLKLDSSHQTINLIYKDDVDTFELESLLTSCGVLEFYETLDRSVVLEVLKNDEKLGSLLNTSDYSNSSAILGACRFSYFDAVDTYLLNNYCDIAGQKIKYLSDYRPDLKGDCRLYLVRQQAFLNKSVISKVHVTKDTGGRPGLMIDFNANGQTIWQDATKSNIGKPIAMVFDNKVVFAPKVMEEIKKGKCQLSGNFTINELRSLRALIINPELPLSFRIK